MAATVSVRREFHTRRRSSRDMSELPAITSGVPLTDAAEEATLQPFARVVRTRARECDDGVHRKVELGCRKAENPLSCDGRQHKRQNSLGGSEVFNLDSFASVVSAQCDSDISLPPPSPPAEEVESDTSQESKTARRRAEFNSKSKNITFNQKKHMTPSYMRRLERRRRESTPTNDCSDDRRARESQPSAAIGTS